MITALAENDLDRAGGFGWVIIAIGGVGACLGLAGIPLAAPRRGAQTPAAPAPGAGMVPPV